MQRLCILWLCDLREVKGKRNNFLSSVTELASHFNLQYFYTVSNVMCTRNTHHAKPKKLTHIIYHIGLLFIGLFSIMCRGQCTTHLHPPHILHYGEGWELPRPRGIHVRYRGGAIARHLRRGRGWSSCGLKTQISKSPHIPAVEVGLDLQLH